LVVHFYFARVVSMSKHDYDMGDMSHPKGICFLKYSHKKSCLLNIEADNAYF
jgi:hypothetical protein